MTRNDSDLIKAVLDSDRSAYAELYARYAPLIRAIGYDTTGDLGLRRATCFGKMFASSCIAQIQGLGHLPFYCIGFPASFSRENGILVSTSFRELL